MKYYFTAISPRHHMIDAVLHINPDRSGHAAFLCLFLVACQALFVICEVAVEKERFDLKDGSA